MVCPPWEGRDGDPSCYFRLAAACPDRGVMGGKEGGGIFWTKNEIGFYSLSFAWIEGVMSPVQTSFFSSLDKNFVQCSPLKVKCGGPEINCPTE